MLTITTSAVMADFISTLTDTTLKRILTDRVDQLADYDGYDLGELAHFLIVQPGDTLDAIEAALSLQLHITQSSESIGLHGKGTMDDGCIDRDDYGAMGFLATRREGPHAGAIHARTCRGVGKPVSRRVTG